MSKTTTATAKKATATKSAPAKKALLQRKQKQH